MKKNTSIYIVIWLVFTLVGGFSFVFAQTEVIGGEAVSCEDSTICGSPPQELAMIVDFVREMMNSIKTIWPQWDYLGKYINPNWFEGTTFTPPEQNILWQVGRNLAQKALFGVATATIFMDPVNFGGFKDFFSNFSLLSKNKVFLRDTQLIEDLESQLSTKKMELGLGGGTFIWINSANHAMMTAIIQTYVDKWLLNKTKSSIPENVLYIDLLFLLTKITSSAKEFLYFDTISQFTEVSKWLDNDLRIAFVDGIGERIQAEYKCAKHCDKNKKTLNALWIDLKSMLSGGFNEWFVAVFKDANDRFVQTFSSETDQTAQFKARKNDLLQSTYGRSERRWSLFDIRADDSDLNKVGESIEDGLASVWNVRLNLWKYTTNKEFRTLVQEEKQARKKATLPDVSSTSYYDASEDFFENILRGYVNDVFEQQTLDIELASFAEVKDVTRVFEVLWAQITAINDKIVWTKTQEWSLVKALWDACELQCGNYWWTCRQ